MRSIPQAAVDFIKAHEGCKLTAYKDSGNLFTIGFGHTGLDVHVGLAIDQAKADEFLRRDLAVASGRLAKVVDESVILALTDNQYAALLSFVFNLGCPPKATLWRRLNARDFDHVPPEFMRWVYCAGKKVQGLVNRRAAEVQLWSTAEPGSVPDEPSSAVTRISDTPALPLSAFSPTHMAAAAVAAAGGVAEGAKKVTDLVQPFADKSDMVQHMLGYAATVGAGAAVVVAFLAWMQSRRAAS